MYGVIWLLLVSNVSSFTISSKGTSSMKESETSVIHLDRSAIKHDQDTVLLSFFAFGKQFKLKMESTTHKLLSPTAHILHSHTIEKDSDLRDHSIFENCRYYQGSDFYDDSLSFAISYCIDSGFKGIIYSEDGIFEINPLIDNRHVIKRLNENDFVEWREDEIANWNHRNSDIEDAVRLMDNDATNKDIRRNLDANALPHLRCGDMAGDPPPEQRIVGKDCALIEAFFISGPQRLQWYVEQNNNNADLGFQRNLEDMIQRIHLVNWMFESTQWKREVDPGNTGNQVDDLCFEFVVGGIMIMNDWNRGIDCGQLTSAKYALCIGEISQFVADHPLAHHFDVIHLMVALDFGNIAGFSWTGTMCSDPRRRVGVSNIGDKGQRTGITYTRTIAHEIGHSLGAQHDFNDLCGGPSGDNLGFIMGYGDPNVLKFSACSIRQIFEEFDNGDLDCLWTNHYQCPRLQLLTNGFNGECGNNKVDFLEECDGGECCNTDCTKILGCCPDGATLECVQIINNGGYEDQYSATYDGYYGGCVESGIPTIYKQNSKGTDPLFLKRVNEINVIRPGCRFKANTSQFGDRWSSSWIIARDGFTDINANTMCAAGHGDTITDCCLWHSVGCKSNGNNLPEYDLSGIHISGFTVRVLDDTAQCTLPFNHTDCDPNLDWNGGHIPTEITITGSKEYPPLNGVYTNNDQSCWDGLPDYVSSFKHLHYDLYDGEWKISYLNTMVIGFAECLGVGINLLQCNSGKWGVNKPMDDVMKFVPDADMTVSEVTISGTISKSNFDLWFINGQSFGPPSPVVTCNPHPDDIDIFDVLLDGLSGFVCGILSCLVYFICTIWLDKHSLNEKATTQQWRDVLLPTLIVILNVSCIVMLCRKLSIIRHVLLSIPIGGTGDALMTLYRTSRVSLIPMIIVFPAWMTLAFLAVMFPQIVPSVGISSAVLTVLIGIFSLIRGSYALNHLDGKGNDENSILQTKTNTIRVIKAMIVFMSTAIAVFLALRGFGITSGYIVTIGVMITVQTMTFGLNGTDSTNNETVIDDGDPILNKTSINIYALSTFVLLVYCQVSRYDKWNRIFAEGVSIIIALSVGIAVNFGSRWCQREWHKQKPAKPSEERESKSRRRSSRSSSKSHGKRLRRSALSLDIEEMFALNKFRESERMDGNQIEGEVRIDVS